MSTSPRPDLRRCFVVPHTHWDREWYLPFEQFQLRLGVVVDEVLDVLERDPEYTSFTLDGQAVVLEDYLEARPENEGRLRALLAGGRLEVGPSYILPDELLVAGESLVRNLLLGAIVCKRFGAQPSRVGYLPDSFGHPLQLPQILAGFGIDSFIFSRGLGDELDELGVIFRWRAPDGSEVLAIQQLASYSNFGHVGDANDAQARVRSIQERFGAQLARAGVRELLLCAGDNHVRIRPDLPALCAELEARRPGTEFVIAGYRDYVDSLEPAPLPVWSGELLGSRLQNILRGVNSARLYLKRANETAESRLLAVETLGALRTLHTGERFPIDDFRLAWAGSCAASRTIRSAVARATRSTATCSSAMSCWSGRSPPFRAERSRDCTPNRTARAASRSALSTCCRSAGAAWLRWREWSRWWSSSTGSAPARST